MNMPFDRLRANGVMFCFSFRLSRFFCAFIAFDSSCLFDGRQIFISFAFCQCFLTKIFANHRKTARRSAKMPQEAHFFLDRHDFKKYVIFLVVRHLNSVATVR